MEFIKDFALTKAERRYLGEAEAKEYDRLLYAIATNRLRINESMLVERQLTKKDLVVNGLGDLNDPAKVKKNILTKKYSQSALYYIATKTDLLTTRQIYSLIKRGYIKYKTADRLAKKGKVNSNSRIMRDLKDKQAAVAPNQTTPNTQMSNDAQQKPMLALPPATTENPRLALPPATTENPRLALPPATTNKPRLALPPATTENPRLALPPATTNKPRLALPLAGTVNHVPNRQMYGGNDDEWAQQPNPWVFNSYERFADTSDPNATTTFTYRAPNRDMMYGSMNQYYTKPTSKGIFSKKQDPRNVFKVCDTILNKVAYYQQHGYFGYDTQDPTKNGPINKQVNEVVLQFLKAFGTIKSNLKLRMKHYGLVTEWRNPIKWVGDQFNKVRYKSTNQFGVKQHIHDENDSEYAVKHDYKGKWMTKLQNDLKELLASTAPQEGHSLLDENEYKCITEFIKFLDVQKRGFSPAIMPFLAGLLVIIGTVHDCSNHTTDGYPPSDDNVETKSFINTTINNAFGFKNGGLTQEAAQQLTQVLQNGGSFTIKVMNPVDHTTDSKYNQGRAEQQNINLFKQRKAAIENIAAQCGATVDVQFAGNETTYAMGGGEGGSMTVIENGGGNGLTQMNFNESKHINNMRKRIRLTESQLRNVVRRCINEAYDAWAEDENRYLTRERLPKGWEQFTDEDGETIYRDEDLNEYYKDEYGRFHLIDNDNWDD